MQDQDHLGSTTSTTINRPFGYRTAKWCIYGLLAFPIIDYTLRLSVIHPIGSIWDKVVLLLLSLIAFNRYIRGYRPSGFAWSKYAGWYILYCFALMLIGIAHPGVSFDGFRMDIYYILFGLLVPFLVDADDIQQFLFVGAAVAFLIGLDGVFQYLLKPTIPHGWVDVNEHVRTRVFSVLKSPNELGAYMEVMVPVSVGLCLRETHRLRKWMYGLCGFFCLLTMLFTYTRGAWMGLGISLFVVAVIYERKLLIVLIILGIAGFFLPPIHHRVMDLFNPVYTIKSAQGGRIVRWQTAFDVMSGSPLFGAGLGRYGGAVASTHGYSVYSDNYYAKIMGESGLVGLVLFVSMHIAILREFLRTVVRRAKGRDRYLALGGLTGIFALLVHNFVENVFEYAPSLVLYFMVVGLFLVWGRSLENQEGSYEE